MGGAQIPDLLQQTLQKMTTNTIVVDEEKKDKVPWRQKRYSPWDSSPPQAIPLLTGQDNTPPIPLAARHKCIANIRDLQISTFQKWLTPSNSQPLLLVDPAYHENVGDLMITVGEHLLLERLGWNPQTKFATHHYSYYQECHYVQADEFVPHCETVILDRLNRNTNMSSSIPAYAIWHGGGNFGDLWPTVQKIRIEQSVQALLAANYSIVGMPQSLFYQHQETEAFEARLLKRQVQKGMQQAQAAAGTHQLVLSWREHESYDRARTLYPFVDHIMLPDIAFQLGPYKRSLIDRNMQVDFLFLLRRDHESALFVWNEETDDADDQEETVEEGDTIGTDPSDIPQVLQTMVSEAMNEVAPTKSYRVVDWPDRHQLFHNRDPFFTETSIQLLSMGQVVICDRLHAAILAFLSGIPFVFLDPSTGKITKCLQVAVESCGGLRNVNQTLESLWFTSAANLTDAIAKGGDFLKLLQ